VVRFIPETHRYQLEYPVGTVLYRTEGWVSNPRFSRDGKTIAFIDHPIFGDDQGSAAMVDLKGNVRKWKQVYGSAQNLAWSADGKEIWFSADLSGVARHLWAAAMDGSERPLLSGPATMDIQDVLPNGRALVTNLAERRVQMIVTPEFPQARDFTWMDWAYSMRFSADGRQLLFGDQHSGDLYGTFLRNVDGSPAVRLGDGDPMDISPDGSYAVSRLPQDPSQIEFLPTGTGEQRQLTHEKFAFQAARWLDNQRLIANANEPGHPVRAYVVDLQGHVTPLTPEGVELRAVTADGKRILLRERRSIGGVTKSVLTIATVATGSGGEVQLGPAVAGPEMGKDEYPLDFNQDGSALFVEHVVGQNQVDIWQLDLATGKRTLLHNAIAPGIPALSNGMLATISRDGKSYAYQYHPALSTLYVIDGLR
jgi:eukaryotic-like serine/threonine-protein kinase